MKKLFSVLTLMAFMASAGYALADGSEPATPSSDTKKTDDKSKKSALAEEKAKALEADLALTDFNPDPSLPSDRRIRILIYNDSDVYTITTKYGYQTNIVFAQNETIDTISVGDRSMWQIIPSANRMFIRPMEENVTTNMTILTNKRSYQFDLKSIGADKEGNNIYVAKFSYPEDEPVATHVAKPVHVFTPAPVPAPVSASVSAPVIAPVPVMPMSEPAPQAHVVETIPSPAVVGTTGPGITKPVHPNYNYTYTGPDELAPLQVYDDGQSTFIKYRDPHPPFPKVFAIDAQGNGTPVSYTIKSDMMAVDNIMEKLSLKSSQGTITVYNEMLNPR